MNQGWIGVDLDGTIAEYHGWVDECHIGAPIGKMVDRVRVWLSEGKDVRIFTARVTEPPPGLVDSSRKSVHEIREVIQAWCVEHVGLALPVTNVKDFALVELWDDRAIQIVFNTGKRADGKQ
jgi:hypothetical protein